MKWIVQGENDSGKIKLVSQVGINGILPKGSYLTIESENGKHVLRVDESRQIEPYNPSSLIVDLNLDGLFADSGCKNEVYAYRVFDQTDRKDGLMDFIKPQTKARRSTQEEVDMALSSTENGPKVFVATIQSNQDLVLVDEFGKHITAKLPESMYFHQAMICGKTGSGKTVAIKYLIQYFVEQLHGAVLAVNVKDVDLLKMEKPTNCATQNDKSEWDSLDEVPHGIDNFVIFRPAGTENEVPRGVDKSRCKEITLDVNSISPESLVGLLQGISEIGALNLPSIFYYWREKKRRKNLRCRFIDFCNDFSNNDSRVFPTLNARSEEMPVTLHKATFDNIVRSLNNATPFFDNEGIHVLDADEVLSPSSLSVIDVTGKNGPQFGSILLRDLLKKIVETKDQQTNDTPVLIVIDEVHQFYNTNASRDALGDLDTICRTGRSKKIGVIFASQNPGDIPTGLSTVVNTKMFFKTDSQFVKPLGIKVSPEELEGLKPGFAVVSVHDLPQLKVIKFPLAYSGVIKNG